ncbi:MAG: BTAD domain-containing putative transcriptional regulator [Solirubrobacteraceae bacterium]|nr:BTAD domain-containing putative transcriptional regulator [Solirubrobacteraceae bacterium]
MDFRILGPIDAQGESGPVALGGSKPRAVLAILLLHANQPVTAEHLARALWGEDSPQRAVRVVHVHVSRLRKALGDPDRLTTTPAGYCLRVARDELDLHRFERLLEAGRHALAAGRAEQASSTLRAALALWRGPALADLALEPFALVDVTRLEELRLGAVEARVKADLDAGRHAALISELRGLVASHPARERLAEHLMLALYRGGRQAEALEVFRDTRQALLDEIGVEPGPELRGLQAAILGHSANLMGARDAAAVAMQRADPADDGTGVRSAAVRGSMPPTKFVVPRARPEWLARERQLAAIDPHARLLLVSAPAGYGKTTLVVQWITRVAGGRVAWVQLSHEDSTASVLWTAIVTALARDRQELGARSLAALAGPVVNLQEEVLVPLVEDLCALDAPPALVLDDVHLVVDPLSHETLAWFIDNAPHEMRVAIATRQDPQLPLGRLRARGELTELRAAQLVFDAREVELFLNGRLELDLAPAELEALGRRTEGWAAGLYLAALSLRGVADRGEFVAAFAGDDNMVVDYLAPEVLRGLDEERRVFLARTSILERFSAPLCEAVTASELDAGELLVELERSNMFLVALDGKRRWFRYHYLFRDMLRAELERTEPALVAELHGRAASWHHANGNLVACIVHHLAAGDRAAAAHRIAASWLALWHSDSWPLVVEWLAELPEDEVAHVPGYLTAKAFVAGVSGQRRELERLVALARSRESDQPLPDGSTSTRGMIAMIEAVFMYRDVGRARAAALCAAQIEHGRVHAMTIPYALGWTGFWSGADEAGVREQLEHVIRMGGVDSAHARVAGALACVAFLDLLAGDLDAARLHVAQAEAVNARTGNTAAAFKCYVEGAAGWLALAEGRLEAAAQRLEETARRARRFDEPLHNANALRLLAECSVAQGRPAAAASYLRRAWGEVRACPDPGIGEALVADSGRRIAYGAALGRPPGG